jgi:hypothetical protein
MINWLEKILLKRFLRHSCHTVPVCGSERKGIKCYRVHLKNRADEYLLYVQEMSSKGFSGTYRNGQDYENAYSACVPFSCMSDVSVEIQRLIDHREFTYQGIFKCALYDLTCLNRIPVVIDAIGQFFFNRRDFALKERTKVLKLLVERYFENPDATFGEFNLVEMLHGHRWSYHPNSWGLRANARLILESLHESGELERVENNQPKIIARYKLTGKALTTLETYEREAIRHEQIISQSRDMKWLTFSLVVVGIIQALVAYFHK